MRFRAVLAAVALVVTGCSSVTPGRGTAANGPQPTTASTAPGAVPTTSALVTGPATTAAPVPSPSGPAPLRTVPVTGQDGTTYQVTVWAEDRITDCAAHAYGKIVQFLQQHPCAHATRRLLVVPLGGRDVAMSTITVSCATGPAPDHTYEYVGQFVKLENADGTGGMNDLLREGAYLPGAKAIPADEAFMVFSQDTVATVFDAWYLGGTTRSQDPALLALEQNLELTPVTA